MRTDRSGARGNRKKLRAGDEDSGQHSARPHAGQGRTSIARVPSRAVQAAGGPRDTGSIKDPSRGWTVETGGENSSRSIARMRSGTSSRVMA